MKKIVIISAVFLFLIGCGVYRVETPGGTMYMSLDEALANAREPDSYNIYGNNSYLYDCEVLWRQAYGKDKIILEKKMLSFLLKQAEMNHPDWGNLERLKKQATSEEVKITVDRKLSEYRQAQHAENLWQAKEQERLERERQIDFETRKKELIQHSDGTLINKSAQQVKKLVDKWIEGSVLPSWQNLAKERYKFFSIENFYKVFGEPDRKQFLSSRIEPASYYFYYNCKDGVVQIKVHAGRLDDEGMVFIQELNIF